MTNDEIRMTKECKMPQFNIVHSFVIRACTFVISDKDLLAISAESY